jgi:Ser/Thr protein kinase RdoA (MazF antagonist)
MQDSGYGLRATLADADMFFLAESFGLDPVISTKDLGGAYNLNLLLKTEHGSYVLRVHRPWVTRLRLEQLQQVKDMLARAGFPVPLPLPTTSGETILRYKDRLVEVEPFIVHDGEADTWERNVIAFSLLGQLHNFLAAHTASIPLVEPVVSNYGTPGTLLRWTQQAAEKMEKP